MSHIWPCPTCGVGVGEGCDFTTIAASVGPDHFGVEHEERIYPELAVGRLLEERDSLIKDRDSLAESLKSVHAATDKTLVQTTGTPRRRRLSDERKSVTQAFRLAYFHKDGAADVMHFYCTVGLYDDGRPGELFIKADKTGTLASGVLDALGVFVSLLLQYGVPVEVIAHKMRHTRFPPAGATKNPEFPQCTSFLDALAQWLTARFAARES